MTRSKVVYTCQQCGASFPKWTGQCPDCNAWNTLEEFAIAEMPPTPHRGARVGGYAGTQLAQIHPLATVTTVAETRTTCGISELDRVLGGGIVSGSVILIGGDPGIGKSTLLLQTLSAISQITPQPPLYVTGEESPQQVSLRAKRLGLDVKRVNLLTETQVEQIITLTQQEQPAVLVIDSIQTIYTDILPSAPGSVAQIRESAAQLVRFAKQHNIAVFLVGHVTKEGELAGPRVLEHMVDTVLYFEGDSGTRFRIIRAIKNRFGAVNELGVFSMTGQGLQEIKNPSAIFMSRHEAEVAGSVITITHEGTRPLLIEVQALVNESHMPNARRVALGLDHNRLAVLLAVLQRHGGIVTYDQDVFVNVVGGMRINETAADLAVLIAVLSSLSNKILPKNLAIFGEIGLAGEIRPVPNSLERLQEATKQGFQRAIVPKSNVPKTNLVKLDIIGVSTLIDALQQV